jgi:uncharacterized protein YdeI (YjbR/CyaY-like superfamily)
MQQTPSFADPAEWSDWLKAHHAQETELWLKLYRKNSGIPSITWEEAVIEALAYGWIDGVKKAGDDSHWFQRFTPRRARSSWSQKNRAHVEKLLAEGRMQPAGLVHVEAARNDGRWDAAYAGSKSAEVPADFLAAIAEDAVAMATYQSLNAANRFAICYRLTTARKPETRAKRLAEMVATLARGERIRP